MVQWQCTERAEKECNLSFFGTCSRSKSNNPGSCSFITMLSGITYVNHSIFFFSDYIFFPIRAIVGHAVILCFALALLMALVTSDHMCLGIFLMTYLKFMVLALSSSRFLWSVSVHQVKPMNSSLVMRLSMILA